MLQPQDSTPNARPSLQQAAESGSKVRRLGAWQVASDLPASFRYAAQGLIYGFRSQRNFRIHVVTGVCVFGLGLWLQLPLPQLAVLVLTVAAVLVLELINTATEAVVDLAIGRQSTPWHASPRIALPQRSWWPPSVPW